MVYCQQFDRTISASLSPNSTSLNRQSDSNPTISSFGHSFRCASPYLHHPHWVLKHRKMPLSSCWRVAVATLPVLLLTSVCCMPTRDATPTPPTWPTSPTRRCCRWAVECEQYGFPPAPTFSAAPQSFELATTEPLPIDSSQQPGVEQPVRDIRSPNAMPAEATADATTRPALPEPSATAMRCCAYDAFCAYVPERVQAGAIVTPIVCEWNERLDHRKRCRKIYR